MEYAAYPERSEPYTPDLRVSYVLGRAWELYKQRLGTVVGATVVVMLIFMLLSGGEYFGLGLAPRVSGNLLVLILGGPFTVGLYSVMLRIVRGEEVSIGGLFDGFKHFGRAVGTYILTMIAVVVGLILLIVPGIIVSVALFPVPFLVYDEAHGVVETLQRAWDLTSGYKFQLFVIGVVVMFVTLLGLVAFIVGIVFTAAFAYLVGAVVYEELSLGAS